MSKLLLHPQTERQLADTLQRLPHALLLSGASGMGKAALARQLAEQALAIPSDSLAAYPYMKLLQPVGGKAISIETVRELEHFLALKIPGNQAISRVAVILDAHLLTTEAQNALLKTLEEPPARTMLILTSAHDQALLPTIRSRVQTLDVKRPTAADLTDFLGAQGHSNAKIQQALAVSGGLPGLAQALVTGDQEHPLVAATQTARALLQKSTYERLLLVDELSKQREATGDVLFILEQMAHTALSNPSQPNPGRWQMVLTAAYHAREQLLASAQPKLALTNLMLNL